MLIYKSHTLISFTLISSVLRLVYSTSILRLIYFIWKYLVNSMYSTMHEYLGSLYLTCLKNRKTYNLN